MYLCIHTGPTRLFCIYRIHAARLHLYGQSREGGPVTKAYLIQPTHRSAIVRVTSRVPWCTRFYQGSQRQISTVNTTGSVPTVFFPRNALSRRAYSADITFQAAINDFLLLQTLRILQYRSIDPFITFILVNILTDSTSVTIFRKCIAR